MLAAIFWSFHLRSGGLSLGGSNISRDHLSEDRRDTDLVIEGRGSYA